MAELEEHVSKCGFTLVSCPNKCEVDGECLQLMRKNVDEHRTECLSRAHSCKKCGETGPYASMTAEHDLVCERVIVSCPNTGCGLTLERSEMKEHIQTVCDFNELPCKYRNIGCNI